MEYTNHNITISSNSNTIRKILIIKNAKQNPTSLPASQTVFWVSVECVKENKTSSLETPSTDESHEMWQSCSLEEANIIRF